MRVISLENIDIDGAHGSIRAYNIDNKDEYIDIKMNTDKFSIINLMGINKENIFIDGYDFFRDFHRVIRNSKVEPVHSRFDILDL